MSSDRLEAIAAEAGRLWFQLYVIRDRAAVDSMISRADHAGCEALVVTVDAPMLGNRGWDSRNYAGKLKLSLRAKLDVLMHLRWLLGVVLPSGLPGFGNLDELLPADRRSPAGEAGASHALQILRDELDRVLALIGCPAVSQLGPGYLFGHSPAVPETSPVSAKSLALHPV